MDWKNIVKKISKEVVNITPQDVDPDEFERGVEVEMEHTDDPEMSAQIALEHFAESKFPKQSKYYTWLDFAEEMNEKTLGYTKEEVDKGIEKLKQYWEREI